VEWKSPTYHIPTPHLHSFAINQEIKLSKVLNEESFQNLFHLPLSEEAFSQFSELELFLQTLNTTNSPDTWSYIWGSKEYSSKKAYKHFTGSSAVHPVYSWIWASSCQAKHKLFYWLLIKNKLNTRGLLRKNMYLESYVCELCILQCEEKMRHLFFKCPFAKNCWSAIGVTVPT
jgi:hypothetical protein